MARKAKVKAKARTKARDIKGRHYLHTKEEKEKENTTLKANITTTTTKDHHHQTTTKAINQKEKVNVGATIASPLHTTLTTVGTKEKVEKE